MGEFKKLKKKLKKANYFGSKYYTIKKSYSAGEHEKRLRDTTITILRPLESWGLVEIKNYTPEKNIINIKLEEYDVFEVELDTSSKLVFEDANEAFKFIKGFVETEDSDKLLNLFSSLDKKQVRDERI